MIKIIGTVRLTTNMNFLSSQVPSFGWLLVWLEISEESNTIITKR